MGPKVTCYGGVGEIGGNKVLLEDKGTKVLIDFGQGFSDGWEYFGDWVKPRTVNGAGDLFEFGLLPEVPGLYSEKALQNTRLKHTSPEVAAVVLSHFHYDHTGRIWYVDKDIPVYCGETTAALHEASSRTDKSPLRGHHLTTFRTGSKFRLGPMEFVPVHVDHSIPGAYGFVVHTSEGAFVYTGDYRFHGRAGSMTLDFMEAAANSEPELLVTEGTSIGQRTKSKSLTEGEVGEEAKRLVAESKNLVFSSFRGNDIDRVVTFSEAAASAGRRLVVSMKIAALLDSLKDDRHLKVPRVGKDVDVYVRRKKSGRLDDKDYFTWEREYLGSGVSAADIRRKQKDVFLHLEASNFPELIDIRPERGGSYIHAATEAFNEEGEREEGLVKNWVSHLGFSYHQVHASGHAPPGDVARLVKGVRAKTVVPVHTEHPRAFTGIVEQGRLTLPRKGIPIQVGAS